MVLISSSDLRMVVPIAPSQAAEGPRAIRGKPSIVWGRTVASLRLFRSGRFCDHEADEGNA
jgi:hypothetical protein